MANKATGDLWAEAKKRCRLSAEAVAMAKEMGLNPRSLIQEHPFAKPALEAACRCVGPRDLRQAGRTKQRRGDDPMKQPAP